jgi:hypothetical protein
MGLDDLVSTESAVVAGITAAVFSPRTRETLRKGAVFGVAGVLKAGDVVSGAARGAVRGVKGDEQAPSAGTDTSDSLATDPAEAAPRRRRTTPKASTKS